MSGVIARQNQTLAELRALRAAGTRVDGQAFSRATLLALDHDIALLEKLLGQTA